MPVEESIRLAPEHATWMAFVKLPEAKVDHFPAATHLRNKHWETTMAQYHLPPGTLIQLQDVVKFDCEVRFWIADKEIVARSAYKDNEGRIWGEEGFNKWLTRRDWEDMEWFAQQVVRDVNQPRGWVLDVGMSSQGPLVVEANAAWSSGPYDGDPEGIFKAIVASHDFDHLYPYWGWNANAVFDKVQPLKVPLGEPCFNCGRRDRDKTKEKCYLC